MNHLVVRKLMRAAALSLLALTMASGVAGLQVLAASPAIAAPIDQAEVDQSVVTAEEDPAPVPPQENPVTKLVGGLLGGVI